MKEKTATGDLEFSIQVSEIDDNIRASGIDPKSVILTDEEIEIVEALIKLLNNNTP